MLLLRHEPGQTDSAHAYMQIGEQRSHLVVGKSPREAGHHCLASENRLPDLEVSGRSAAGQIPMRENAVQVGWNLLQCQIVVFVAMSAANRVEVLALLFLRCQGRLLTAAGNDSRREQKHR